MNSIIIYPPESSVAFYVFNYPIHYYGLIISFAIFLGIFLAYLLTKKRYSFEFATNFTDTSASVIILSIIGARLFYILGDYSYYLSNPKEIIMINHGGLSIWGGILVGAISIFYYCKKQKIELLKTLDIYALFLPLCQAIGRWGNFFNQEAYGKPTSGLIQYYINPTHRYPKYATESFYHPTFLYEMIADIIIFAILFLIFKKHPKNGIITALYLILYGIIRTLIEQIRIDSVCYIFNIPIAAILSIIAVISGIILLIKIQKS